MLLLLACGIFSDDVQQALPAAAAVEVFHNFTLLHDDIMDNAALRRGKPSVHAKWGRNVAILSGDAMLIWAYRLLACVPAVALPRVLETFNGMALEVCEGQQYDMDFERRQKVPVVEYLHMIEQKTSVLLAGSVVIGAMLGGASARIAASCATLPSSWDWLSSFRTTCWIVMATNAWVRLSAAIFLRKRKRI